jgi:hypothetical protein
VCAASIFAIGIHRSNAITLTEKLVAVDLSIWISKVGSTMSDEELKY